MATDIATGWSESLPIVMRDGAVVLTALQLIRRQLPFSLRGIDADNDPVFMNSLMEAWCDRPGQQIVLTRSRAYTSNDQAWVEQKNGMLVRRVVGYQRLVSLEAAQVLGELYGALRLFTNLFQPSFKLKSSERDGGRIKRQHHPPRTPLQRLLARAGYSRPVEILCGLHGEPGGSAGLGGMDARSLIRDPASSRDTASPRSFRASFWRLSLGSE